MSNFKNSTSVRYKRFLFSAKDVFLSDEVESTADINYFIQVPYNVNNQLTEFYTLLIDLRMSPDEIWSNIYHRTRSEIQSFISNTKFEHSIKYNLSDRELRFFIALYDSFVERKKIRKAETKRIHAYNKEGIFAVSFIRQNEKYICINFYRVTFKRATNLHSFRLHEIQPTQLSNSQYGKAHRALHWLDMLEFKKNEVQYYDFCGWYNGKENKELLNINAFKEQFTSYKVLEYTGVIYKNKLLNCLKNRFV